MREPPPRQAKLAQLLRNSQLEQLAKLQNKHQQECDLLDDIRNFGKHRSQIEKEYGQALQKLVSQYQKKDWTPFVNAEDTEKRPVLGVWKSILDATEMAAQARINGSENYKNNIYEATKTCRSQKEVQLKKCQELLSALHSEVAETIKELTKAKKKYCEVEQVTTVAREKYQEVQDRLKKNQTSIFKSKAGLEKTLQKLQQKYDESTKNSTLARNEYILMLGAANSHQKRYYEVDMPEAIRVLDGQIFTNLQEYLGLLCRYELNTCNEIEEHYVKALHHAAKISREPNLRGFLKENPLFEWGPRYEFEPYCGDKNQGKLIKTQNGSDNSLDREARKWTYRVERENKQLERLRKLMESLEAVKEKYTQHPEMAGDDSAQETEMRLEKCKQDIRKVETCRLQGEARLLLLRETDVDVDSWVESAKAQVAKEGAAMASRTSFKRKPSTPKKETSDEKSDDDTAEAVDESFYDDFYGDDFDETFDDEIEPGDSLSIPSSELSRVYPVTCRVSYPYQATRSDELTIAVGDKIEVVEDGDLDQWVKARDHFGNFGYVPEYYLEFPSSPARAHHHYSLPPGDDSSVSDSASTSGVTSRITVGPEKSHILENAICLAKAIYEYEACTDEELSFPEGAIINVLTKDDNGVDDGWWKGELNGKVGVFPGLVVEEIDTETKSSDFLMDSRVLDLCPGSVPLPPNDCPPILPAIRQHHSPRSSPVPNVTGSQCSSVELTSSVQSDLRVPYVRHERASSDPIRMQASVKPLRVAPAPPMRPRSPFGV